MRRYVISFDDGSMNHISEADLPAVGEVARDLRHSLGACDIAQRARNAGRIVGCLVEPGVQVRWHVLVRLQVLGDVVRRRLGFGLARTCACGAGHRQRVGHRSPGFKPVCFAMRASMLGPISSPS